VTELSSGHPFVRRRKATERKAGAEVVSRHDGGEFSPDLEVSTDVTRRPGSAWVEFTCNGRIDGYWTLRPRNPPIADRFCPSTWEWGHPAIAVSDERGHAGHDGGASEEFAYVDEQALAAAGIPALKEGAPFREALSHALAMFGVNEPGYFLNVKIIDLRAESARREIRRKRRRLRLPRDADGRCTLPVPALADALERYQPGQRWAPRLAHTVLVNLCAPPDCDEHRRTKWGKLTPRELSPRGHQERRVPAWVTRGMLYWVHRAITPRARGGGGRVNIHTIARTLLDEEHMRWLCPVVKACHHKPMPATVPTEWRTPKPCGLAVPYVPPGPWTAPVFPRVKWTGRLAVTLDTFDRPCDAPRMTAIESDFAYIEKLLKEADAAPRLNSTPSAITVPTHSELCPRISVEGRCPPSSSNGDTHVTQIRGQRDHAAISPGGVHPG
jgi:hypothetical protein